MKGINAPLLIGLKFGRLSRITLHELPNKLTYSQLHILLYLHEFEQFRYKQLSPLIESRRNVFEYFRRLHESGYLIRISPGLYQFSPLARQIVDKFLSDFRASLSQPLRWK